MLVAVALPFREQVQISVFAVALVVLVARVATFPIMLELIAIAELGFLVSVFQAVQ